VKDFFAYIVAGIVVFAIILLLSAGGVLFNRHAAPYAEETRRLTFEQSKAHQDGTNRVIIDYCLNMRTATDPSQKKAYATFILSQAGTYTGPLTADAQQCVREAQGM